MNLIRSPRDAGPSSVRSCLAIGVFDGVHLGHQQVIRQMVADARQHEARSVVVTFDRHPNTVVAPNRVPPQIQTLTQKLRVIAALGVDATRLIHFDEPFSKQSGEDFIRGLIREFGRIHSICVGSTFTFGHKRGGNVALLKTLGQELQFTVHGLAALSLDGEPVSSTRIREAIRAGQLDQAGQMSGRAYSLAGLVVRGDQLGRRLGFPTANIDVTGLVIPPTGVYAIHVYLRGRPSLGPAGEEAAPSDGAALSSSQGATDMNPLRGVLNIGHRPTLETPLPQLRVEAHLFDFNGDLYGQEMEIMFVEKIREEQKFPSLDALKSQIARDITAAKARF